MVILIGVYGYIDRGLSVAAQVTPDDGTIVRVAADEDVPLVLNAQQQQQQGEWVEDPLPSDIVQAYPNHYIICCILYMLYYIFQSSFTKLPSLSRALQISANLLDTAVACAMRRDGFSVSSNGKLGQPGDVAALMKEAQVQHARPPMHCYCVTLAAVACPLCNTCCCCRCCTASRCTAAAARSCKPSSPTCSTRSHCTPGA